jgi:hypothetical protein
VQLWTANLDDFVAANRAAFRLCRPVVATGRNDKLVPAWISVILADLMRGLGFNLPPKCSPKPTVPKQILKNTGGIPLSFDASRLWMEHPQDRWKELVSAYMNTARAVALHHRELKAQWKAECRREGRLQVLALFRAWTEEKAVRRAPAAVPLIRRSPARTVRCAETGEARRGGRPARSDPPAQEQGEHFGDGELRQAGAPRRTRRFLCPRASRSPNARHAQRPPNDDESTVKRWILLNLKVAENGRGHACFILKVGQQKLRAAYLAANPTLNTRRVAPLPGAP